MRSTHRRVARSFVAATLAVAGCSPFTGPDRSRELGIISYYNQPIEIAVPAAAAAGVPFEVSVRTYGGGCITPNGTDVQADGLVADVTPYDDHSDSDICADVLGLFDHTATLTFASPGTALIRFHGMEHPGDRQIVVERSVRID